MKAKPLLALLNSYLTGVAGGTIRFIEILKRINNKTYNLKILISLSGKKKCTKSGLKNADFIITNDHQKNIIITYLKRIFTGYKLSKIDKKIIYCGSDFLPDVIPAFFRKNRNIKWIQIIHHLYKNPFKRRGNNLFSNFIGFIGQRVSFSLIKLRANHIITVNPFVKKQLIKIGFNKDKISVNPNGIDIDKIQSYNSITKKYDCSFLGRLNTSKGIFDLIDIIKKVKKYKENISLAIIGAGNKKIKTKLEKAILKNNLSENIDVLGYLTDDKTFGIIKSSKLFLLPSHEEGFGISILEAMACGTPGIVWNLPAYNYIFKEGIVKIPENNIKKFSREVLKLLDQNNQRKLLEIKAKKQARKYDWNKIARCEEKIIEEVVNE